MNLIKMIAKVARLVIGAPKPTEEEAKQIEKTRRALWIGQRTNTKRNAERKLCRKMGKRQYKKMRMLYRGTGPQAH